MSQGVTNLIMRGALLNEFGHPAMLCNQEKLAVREVT